LRLGEPFTKEQLAFQIDIDFLSPGIKISKVEQMLIACPALAGFFYASYLHE